MSIITTTEANDIMLEIVDLQAELMRRLMDALRPLAAYENELKQIEEKKMQLEGHRGLNQPARACAEKASEGLT